MGLSPAMRERLTANQQGKLTTSQWKDMVTEPLAPLLLLILPAILIFGRFGVASRFILLAFPAVLIVLLLVGLLRARRYARLPVQFQVLYAEKPGFLIGLLRPIRFVTDSGTQVVFHRLLMPRPALKADYAYLVYYLNDPGRRILLSMTPADAPDADRWKPSEQFEQRHQSRS